MIVTNDPILLPFVMAIWVFDLFMVMILLRLLLGNLPGLRTSHAAERLRDWVDPFADYMGDRVARWRRRPTPAWLSWNCLILTVLVLRNVLLGLIIRFG